MQFQLSDRIPKNNFYRRLKEVLDLDFLYKKVKPYYGSEGQKPIDPTVFVKIMLVGYLENIISDRALLEHISMRMDLLYFIGYDIDEELPWHSTLSRTRQKLPEKLYEEVFAKVLAMCIKSGLVKGDIQAVDSAYIKANASLDSLEEKQPVQKIEEHNRKVREENNPPSKDKHKQDTPEWKKKEVSRRIERQKQQYKGQPGSNKGGRYLSNHTHYSPTDPDSRIAVKPGKPRQMYYLSNMSVDTGHHVITHIESEYADLKDSQTLIGFLENMLPRLSCQDLRVSEVLADAGYNSGANLKYLEEKGIKGYIPPHGQYERNKPGFTYDEENNFYICRNGKRLVYKKTIPDVKGHYFKHYSTSAYDCKGCLYAKDCKGKANERRIRVTVFKPYHDRMEERMETKQGKRMRKLRQSTVEPVFGSLINFYGMRKVNVRGMKHVHKCMQMAATAYNIKKLMKHISKARGSVMIKMPMPANSYQNNHKSLVFNVIGLLRMCFLVAKHKLIFS